MKLFSKWDSSNVKIKDPGLKPYINLDPVFIPRSSGIHQKYRFHRNKVHIIERLTLHLTQPGHKGKKHRISSGHLGGSFYKALKIVEKALSKIKKETKKNPIQVVVGAVENAAMREEVISYQVGSIMVRKAVLSAPQRRVDKALRLIAQGTYNKSHASKKKAHQALKEEIVLAYNNNNKCRAIKEKERLEREAQGAR